MITQYNALPNSLLVVQVFPIYIHMKVKTSKLNWDKAKMQ
jgi:hypothetical protein